MAAQRKVTKIVAKVGRDQIHLVPVISEVGGDAQWRSQKFSTGGASADAHIVCRIRLESVEARLSLIDKNIGTSARYYA